MTNMARGHREHVKPFPRNRPCPKENHSSRCFYKDVIMLEILTAVTYLVVWLICEKIIQIESGLVKLLISLGCAVGVYVAIAVKAYHEKKKQDEA